MAAHPADEAPTDILDLPNELLSRVVSHLGSRVQQKLPAGNYRFQSLVDYHRVWHTTGLTRLLNTLIRRIATHLDNRESSRFARTSYRF